MPSISTLFLVVALLFVSSFVTAALPPVFSCRGTYYTCAFQIGQQAKQFIHVRLQQKDVQHAKSIINTDEGATVFKRYQDNTAALFPQQVKEMTGLADGAGVTYDQIFLLVAIDALGGLEGGGGGNKPNPWLAPSCTDVWSNAKGGGVIAHNEDNILVIENITYITNVTILSEGGEVIERFLAYAYPGLIAGNFFGVSNPPGTGGKALAFSDNFVFTKYTNGDTAVPGNCRARAAFSAKSRNEVLTIFASVSGGSGSNFNVLEVDSIKKSSSMMSIETDPLGSTIGAHSLPPASTIHKVPNTPEVSYWMSHTNMFRWLDNATGSIGVLDPSSQARLDRIAAIAAEKGIPQNVQDLRNILGDTKDADLFPIYRTGTKADSGVRTLATFIVDVASRQMFLWGLTNPKERPDAIMSLDLN